MKDDPLGQHADNDNEEDKRDDDAGFAHKMDELLAGEKSDAAIEDLEMAQDIVDKVFKRRGD